MRYSSTSLKASWLSTLELVNNAIRSCGQCGERLYDLIENVSFNKNSMRESAKASKSKIRKVRNWSNFKRGIFNVYEFNMTYWHDINLRKLIG